MVGCQTLLGKLFRLASHSYPRLLHRSCLQTALACTLTLSGLLFCTHFRTGLQASSRRLQSCDTALQALFHCLGVSECQCYRHAPHGPSAPVLQLHSQAWCHDFVKECRLCGAPAKSATDAKNVMPLNLQNQEKHIAQLKGSCAMTNVTSCMLHACFGGRCSTATTQTGGLQ